MNKKGFTLVELLAVIAILAILVVMAMPNVLDMFNTSKKNSFKNEVQAIMRQAGTDYIESTIGNSPITSFTDTLGNLNMNTSLKYEISLNSEGKIETVAIYNNKYCYYRHDEDGISHTDTINNSDIVGFVGSDCVPAT